MPVRRNKHSFYVFEGTRRYQFNTINGKKGGRKWEIVTLKRIDTGEIKGFKSKSECSRWLRDEFGFSTREFNKFTKGQGKICDMFILMKDSSCEK